jgi:NADPH2:quinone reductase
MAQATISLGATAPTERGENMRAVQVRPEGLVYAEVPDPAIGVGDVLVRVEAAGINYLDTNTFVNARAEDMPLPLGGEAGGLW